LLSVSFDAEMAPGEPRENQTVLTRVAGMPAKPEGAYADKRGGWYFKVT
jgi:hypothetical protein